jgi:hypothetical protein
MIDCDQIVLLKKHGGWTRNVFRQSQTVALGPCYTDDRRVCAWICDRMDTSRAMFKNTEFGDSSRLICCAQRFLI